MARRPDTPFVLRLLMALVRGFAYLLSCPSRRTSRHPAVPCRQEPSADRRQALQYNSRGPEHHHLADSAQPLASQQTSMEPSTPLVPETPSQGSRPVLPPVIEPDAELPPSTAPVGHIDEKADADTEPASFSSPEPTPDAPESDVQPPAPANERDGTPIQPRIPRSQDDLLSDYVTKFRSLRRFRNPRVWPADTLSMSPHKPILLLAVLSLIADGTITDNVVTFDEPLLSRFDAFWRCLMGDGRSAGIHYPLFHLRNEGFWHLQPTMSVESDHDIHEVHSLAALRRLVSGASFDEELFALLQDTAARATLRDALLSAHFTDEAAHRLIDVQDAGLPGEGPADGEPESDTLDEDTAPTNCPDGTGTVKPPTVASDEPSPGNSDQGEGETSTPEGDAPIPAETGDAGPVVGTDPDEPVTETNEAGSIEEGDDVLNDDWFERASDTRTATEWAVAPPAEPATEPEPGDAAADDDRGTSLQCTIHVEVFVASRMLASRNPTFTRQELVQTIQSLFGDTRPGVVSYVRSSRCIANRPFSSRYAFNYLWELDGRLLRCFRPGEDHPLSRRHALRVQPDLADVPEQYRHLLHDVVIGPVPEAKGPADALDDAGPTRPQTLGGWERHLGPRLSELEMVYQLDLSQEDTKAIGTLVRDIIRRRGPTRALDQLERYNPVTLVCYLTFAGVYGYSHGNYWAAVCKTTSLPYAGPYTSDWGFRYLNVCERLGLRTEIDRDSYVDLILFQAGIPRSCLNGFFEHMLLPSFSRPELSALETTQVIEHWLTSSVRYFVPKPVLRFLEYGGSVAETYVRDFRTIAAAALQEMRSTDSASLPTYAVSAFAGWFCSGGGRENEEPEEHSERFAAPEIRVDPWGDGPFLRLAPQSVSGSRPGQAVWRVFGEGAERTCDIHTRSSAGMLLIEETTVSIPSPWSTMRVSLEVGDSLLRSWECRIPSLEAGYIVFDSESGALAADPEGIRSDRWWLFLAPSTQATVSPQDTRYLRETFPPVGGGWNGWRAQEIDVSSVSEVIIQNGPVTTRLTPGRDRREPRLVGGHRIDLPPLSCPLYAGPPPLVRLPAVGESSRGTSDWDVAITSVGRAIPACSQRLTVRTSTDGHSTDGGYELALADERILGKRAFGEYTIDCASGDGLKSLLRFRIVPRLEVSAPTSIVLPETVSLQPVVVGVAVDAPTEVVPTEASQVRRSTVEATAGERRHRFIAAADVTALRLQLRRRTGALAVAVDLSIPVPRLRWRLATAPHAGHRWGQHALCTSLDEFDQSEAPALLVDAPRLPEDVVPRVAVLSRDGEVLQELEAESLGSQPRLFRYDLRLLRDTLRRLQGLDVTLQLRLDRRGGETLAEIAVARITEHAVLQHLVLHRDLRESERWLQAEWAPNPPVRNRILRLHSSSRPWEEPLSLRVPDQARATCEWQLDSPDPSDGFYLAEMVAEDPWVSADPAPPSADSPHLIDLELGDAAARYAALLALGETGTASHADVGECLLLAKRYADEHRFEPLLDRLYRNAETCPIAVLVPIVTEFPGSPSARAIVRKLFTPDRIRQVVQAYGMGEWDPVQFRAYLDLRPPLSGVATEAIEALLDIEDRIVSLEAAQVLVERHARSGYAAVVRQLTDGEITVDDGLDVLLADPKGSIDYLCATACRDDARVLSLLEALQAIHPEHIRRIRPGYWIRCRMGWGLIKGIRAQSCESSSALAEDLPKGVLLDVVVRPAADTIAVTVDVAGKVLHVQGRNRGLWECTKCSSFVTADVDLLRGQHNHAAHGGLSPAMRPLPVRNSLPLGKTLTFSVSEPKSIWT